jgi:phage terminase large subunit-like protein
LERRLGVPLRQWAEQGFLELCPGNVIDQREIRARLEWGRQMFDLQEVGWDPYNTHQISVPMIDDGFRCFDIKQGFMHLSEPTKKIINSVVDGKFHHGGHPVYRWHAGCATTVPDGKDNIMFKKPDRATSASRIDGMSATACAMARAIAAESNYIQVGANAR